MNALTGMEKFSHLEDKIYLTIEFAKKMREEKEKLERETDDLKRAAAEAIDERNAMEEKMAAMLSERDTIQLKVEAMLDAIMTIEPDVAEAVAK
jgi:FtsZ-binding cell division protein ZapB